MAASLVVIVEAILVSRLAASRATGRPDLHCQPGRIRIRCEGAGRSSRPHAIGDGLRDFKGTVLASGLSRQMAWHGSAGGRRD